MNDPTIALLSDVLAEIRSVRELLTRQVQEHVQHATMSDLLALKMPPVTTWTQAAAILGISVDTLARRRAAHDPDRKPRFGSPAEVVEWYTGLGQPVAPRERRSRTSRPRVLGTDEPSF